MTSTSTERTETLIDRHLPRLVALAGACAMLIASRVWSTRREVPLVPALELLGRAPEAVHRSLFYAALFSAGAVCLRPKSRWPKALLLFCWLALFAGDVLRFQVWFYDWSLWLVILLAASADAGEESLNALRCAMIGLYFWAGYQKMNSAYVHTGFLPFVRVIAPSFPEGGFSCALGLASALFESGVGLALLWPRTRRLGILGALCAHAFILFCLIKWRWDAAVWPLNVFQILVLPLLFLDVRSSPLDILRPRSVVGAAARALFLLAPAFNMIGLWDDSVSLHFYSKAATRADLIVGSEFIRESALPLEDYWDPKTGRLPWAGWSTLDNGHNLYPTEWYLRAAFARLCERERAARPLELIVFQRPDRWTGEPRRLEIGCPPGAR